MGQLTGMCLLTEVLNWTESGRGSIFLCKRLCFWFSLFEIKYGNVPLKVILCLCVRFLCKDNFASQITNKNQIQSRSKFHNYSSLLKCFFPVRIEMLELKCCVLELEKSFVAKWSEFVSNGILCRREERSVMKPPAANDKWKETIQINLLNVS